MIPLFIFTRLLILIWGLSLVILSLIGAFVGFFAAVLRALIEGVALQKVHWSGVMFSFTLCFTGVPFLVYLVADLPIQIALLPFALVYCALYSDEESTFTEHLVELCQSYSLCIIFCDSYIRAILG